MATNLKHAVEYPAMSHGLVSLRLATNNDEWNSLNEELANDMEARANLSMSYFSFEPIAVTTWMREVWIIKVRQESVGFIEIHRDREHDTAGLTVAIKKTHRDGVIGVKAIALIIRYMFDVLGIRKLETNCFSFNLRARKIYSGFLISEGCLRESVRWAGRYWDKHLFGLNQAQWSEQRAKVDRILR